MTGTVFPQLKTDRLILREHRPQDQEAVFSIFSDVVVTRYYLVQPFTQLAQAEAVVQSRMTRFYEDKGIRWAIAWQEDGALLGSCGFSGSLQARGVWELGYELARPYWNRGIMTEALRACISYACKTWQPARIEAQILPENQASRRVLEKIGFRWTRLREGAGYLNGRSYDLALFVLDPAE